MPRFHELRVKSISFRTDDAVEVGFAVPPELESSYDFVAGQYLTIEKEIAGKSFRRSYSICSAPGSGKLHILVKKIPRGLFSAWVHQKLKVDDTLNVYLPEGRFVFEPTESEQNDYLALAAGSGITPIISIIQTALAAEPQSRFVLVYGNKTRQQTIFYEDLMELRERYSGRFFVEFSYSQVKEKTTSFKRLKKKLFKRRDNTTEEEKPLLGRIDAQKLDYIFKEKYRNFTFKKLYLCGPEPMIEMAVTAGQKHGLDETQIRHELFVTKKDKRQKDDDKPAQGTTKVTVILDDEEVTFEMDRQTRVLDAVMEAGLDPPYSCQGGTCSSCIGQIVEGDVSMANNQILTKGEVESGMVLTCQAHPTTPTLVIDYDEM